MIRENGLEAQNSRASLELLYNISRELAAALDLRTVLQRVLSLSMKNVGAINGSILVLDEQGELVESAILTGEQLHEQTTPQLRITLERGLAGWVFRNRQAALVANTLDDERWVSRLDEAGEPAAAKSAVSAPILAREQLVGVITLVHPEPGFFTREHLDLVQAIADQAGIAILNARLYAESQRQARLMAALAESSAAITASLKLDEVLERILDQTSQALRVEVVSLALLETRTQELVYRAVTGEKKSQAMIGLRLTSGQDVAGWVVRHGEGAVIADASQDDRVDPSLEAKLGFTRRAIACAPIRSQGEVIGVLEACNPLEGAFDPDALLVLMRIGSLAGTAIRHAQLFELLQAAHQRYRELFEDSIEPILITDWDGKILEANRQVETITGQPNQSLIGMQVNQLQVVNPEIVGEFYEKLSSGETCTYEATLSLETGREVPVQVYVRKVQIEGMPHLQWILRDITERKNLDNLRNDLISMIYHDLRSPLANVVSSLDVLEAMLPPQADPSLHSLLKIAIRSTERIQRLTSSLLDLRRLEAGQPIANQQPTAPASLCNEALEVVMPVLTNKNQEISLLLPDDLPQVWVDADMIRRVLTNLLENAVKYTPAGSKITVGAQASDDQVLMWVQDTGPGIPPSEQERIFDKFTRLHGKTGPRGFGLGLAFCRLAVEAHGGRIWVESSPGSGACFKFTLPIAMTPLNLADSTDKASQGR